MAEKRVRHPQPQFQGEEGVGEIGVIANV